VLELELKFIGLTSSPGIICTAVHVCTIICFVSSMQIFAVY